MFFSPGAYLLEDGCLTARPGLDPQPLPLGLSIASQPASPGAYLLEDGCQTARPGLDPQLPSPFD